MSFIAQLEAPSPEAIQAEQEGLLRMTPGPGKWRVADDLHFLKESFGQPLSFQSVIFQAKAAKLRVVARHVLWRDSKRDSEIHPQLLSIERMHSKIRSLLTTGCRYPDRVITWKTLY